MMIPPTAADVADQAGPHGGGRPRSQAGMCLRLEVRCSRGEVDGCWWWWWRWWWICSVVVVMVMVMVVVVVEEE